MKVLCKRDYIVFKEGETYEVIGMASVFDKDDFISIASSKDHTKATPVYRFRMDRSQSFIEDYIGLDEVYFYDFFCDIKEERKTKLQNLSK